jgi:hypothetical protein
VVLWRGLGLDDRTLAQSGDMTRRGSAWSLLTHADARALVFELWRTARRRRIGRSRVSGRGAPAASGRKKKARGALWK